MLKKQKPQEVKLLKKLLETYKVIGILNMHGLPARQLQNIRDKLRKTAVIRMSKKNLLVRAMNLIDGLDKLPKNVTGESAIILSNENPFKLFKILKDSRAAASAKAGQVPKNDIVAQKGSTGIAAGPAISAFQKLKIKTSVQNGKIAIMSDKVVCKAGETITNDMVNLFALLKLEPMEIGLDMVLALEDSVIYGKDVLDIDTDEYLANIQRSIQEGISLSLEIGWITKDIAPLAISKAFREAKELCLECNIIEKDFIDEVLMKAVREAKALEDLAEQSSAESQKAPLSEEKVPETKEEQKEDTKKETSGQPTEEKQKPENEEEEKEEEQKTEKEEEKKEESKDKEKDNQKTEENSKDKKEGKSEPSS